MPNNQTRNDADLSALLSRAEPPKSPQHVDDFILNYAKENAPRSDAVSPGQFLFFNKQWLSRNWISAVATFSIAVVAVSVTLQGLNTPVLEQAGIVPEADSELVSLADSAELVIQAVAIESSPARANEVSSLTATTNAPLTAAEPADTDAVNFREREQSNDNALAIGNASVAGLAVAGGDQTADADLAKQQAEQSRLISATDDTAVPALERQLAFTNAASPVVSSATDSLDRIEPAAANRVLEEADSVIAEELDNAVSRRIAASTTIAGGLIVADTVSELTISEQNVAQFLVLLEQVLIESNQRQRAEVAVTTSPAQRALLLSQSYDELTDSGGAAEVANRYLQARSDFTAFELPASLDAAMAQLQLIVF